MSIKSPRVSIDTKEHFLGLVFAYRFFSFVSATFSSVYHFILVFVNQREKEKVYYKTILRRKEAKKMKKLERKEKEMVKIERKE